MKKPTWFAQGPACSFRLFLTVEIINVVLTLILFSLGVVLNNSQNDNAGVQRADQISYIKTLHAQCVLDSKRAEAQQEFQQHNLDNRTRDLAQSRKDLATLTTLPQFNTPAIRKVTEASLKRQVMRREADVKASKKLLAAYVPVDCSGFKVPNK